MGKLIFISMCNFLLRLITDFYVNTDLRSSRPKVISPETRVMLPEIHSHVVRNPKSCRPKFFTNFLNGMLV